MAKKAVVWGGAGVALLLIIGGVFLFLGRKKDVSYTSIPTTWSQEGDYEIKTEGTKTAVTNTKAGYSFEVPEGWKVGKTQGGSGTILDITSGDASFDRSNFLQKGCRIIIGTEYNIDRFTSLQNSIAYLSKNQEPPIDDNVIITKGIKNINGLSILSTEYLAKRTKVFGRFSKLNALEIPLPKETILTLEGHFLEESQNCETNFQRLVEGIKL